MLNHVQHGFSSKNLCIRPRQPMGITQHEEAGYTAEQLAEIEKSNGVDKLEQQVRDALFARTTAHLGEHRILKSAFNRFDKDASGSVDIHEFEKALEHLGLHTADGGLPGAGGLPTAVVHGLFYRYDTDGSGHVDYEEFCAAVLQEDRMHKML